MSDITQCPECQRKLNVPDGQLGTAVRCPACGADFTAERYVPPRPEAVTPEPQPEPPPQPRGGPRDYPPRDAGRRDDYDDRDDDYPERPRSRYPRGRFRRGYGDYQRPNRGSTIQTMGILCLCLCWTTFPCWILGTMALVMGGQDLSAMNNGTMDDSGRGQIKTGQVCAIIGLCASVCLVFACCGVNFLAAVGR